MKYETYKKLTEEQKEEYEYKIGYGTKIFLYCIMLSLITSAIDKILGIYQALYFLVILIYYQKIKGKKLLRNWGIEE